jgi:transcriptional regulator with XRE-family HTH domain
MNNLTPQDRETLDNFRGMTVGKIFIRARESQNVTVEQVATHLNISSNHLQAIEDDDVNNLPPKVYAVGFVRAYADLLQLDSEKMAYLFKVQCYGRKQTDERKQIVRPEGKKIEVIEVLKQKIDMIPMLLVSVFGIVLMLSVLVIFIIWLMGFGAEKKALIPEVPVSMLEVPDAQNEDSSVIETSFVKPVSKENVMPPIEPMDIILKPDDGATAYGASSLEAELAFKIVKDVWGEFRSLKGGKVLLSQTFLKGDVLFVPKGIDVLVTTGNAAAIEVYLDNQSLGLIGKQAEIIRLRPFSVKALRLQ